MDASKLGTKVKDGKNQKTLLSAEDENKIIDTINNYETVENFSIVVENEKIKTRNYSFSAGQFFETTIEYSEITQEEFENKMEGFENNLDSLFEQSKNLEESIRKQLLKIEYAQADKI
ncbi:MAG TPA: N-6 DNA methylase [Bacteroidia bacterium]|nr:N-6 DNA methylase [Bacteroidia bacterium]